MSHEYKMSALQSEGAVRVFRITTDDSGNKAKHCRVYYSHEQDVFLSEVPGGQAYLDSIGGWPLAPETQQPTLDEAKAAKLAAIQAEKARARDAGFLVNGTLFDSDSAARVAYLELAMRLQAEPVFSTFWKASDGVWVTMDAALFAQVYAAGEAHIAACFAWQSAREAEVAAAQTVEAVQAVSASYGLPE